MTDEILIAGAGIGGLATALALAKSGKPSRVLEQAIDIEEIGAGLQLGPNASGVLEQLGINDEINQLAGFPEEVRILDGVTGKRLNRVVLDAEFVSRFGAPYRVIHRGDLLGTLLRACEAQGGIAIETAATVQSFADEGTVVEVQTRKGSRTGSALVGADGIRSAIRGQLLDDGPPVDAGHAIARALIPAADMPLKDNAVCLWLIPGGHVVHYPVRGGEMYNLVVAWDGEWSEVGWSAEATAAEVEGVTARAVKRLQAVLQAAPSWRKWSAADRSPVEKWGEGRVTLLGDAAHAVLPYLAQGAVMALEDAVVLAKELETHAATEGALRSYEAARQPRLKQMHEMCRKAGMAYHADGGFRVVRNFILRTMSGKASRNRVAWIYDWRL